MLKTSKKYFTLALFGFLSMFILGIISPKIVDYYTSNWAERFNKIKLEIVTKVQTNILDKEASLNQLSRKLERQITSENANTSTDILGIVTSDIFSNIFVNVFSQNELVGWNKSEIVNSTHFSELKEQNSNEEVFFLKTPLHVYLSKITFKNGFSILTAVEIEKKYQLSKSKSQAQSIIADLENEFNAVISMQYDNFNYPKSIKLNNSNGFQIGSITIQNISRDADTAKLVKKLELIQSLVLILTFIIIALWIFQKVKQKKRLVKLLFFLSVIIFGRYLLFWLNISDLIGFSNIINPIYFSSAFGNGIAKSPLELFITVVSALLISFSTYRFLLTISLKSVPKFLKVVFALLLLLLHIVLYVSFAATIKSIIFDSSILYFKSALLFSSYQTSFMYLTILLVGLTALFFAISIFTIFNQLLTKLGSGKNWIYLVTCFIIFSSILIISEILFPKSSFLLVTIYSILVITTSYYWIKQSNRKVSGVLLLLLSSSVLSISFLNFYNSELERISLKTIANEITRSNVEFYEYYVDNAIETIKNDTFLKEMLLEEGVNYDEIAFALWTKSGLPINVKSSSINIIDSSKSLLGSFNYKFNKPFTWNWGTEKIDSVEKREISQNNFSSNSKYLSALVPISRNKSILGFIEITAHYPGFSVDITEDDALISGFRKSSVISVNPRLLKIFEFSEGELSNYYTNVFLTKQEKSAFTHATPFYNKDVWFKININDEENIFYLKQYVENGIRKTLAVGLRWQDISWNLFDFFKVFFIHSIMILILIFSFLLFNFNKLVDFHISFKTKILSSLLIISIIPLILLATYFKSVSDTKNYNAVNYKLGKRADNVEEYVNNYIASSSLTEKKILDKAVRDLGISFSLFDGKELLYSADGSYYRAGLLSKIINPFAYLSLNVDGLREVIIEERFENQSYNSLYHRINIGGYNYIIKISDLFNKFQLPMTGIELNVMLFGTYSLAILLVIILSTFLANQISAPIEKLTKATRSVSRGDMDIQIGGDESGEIKELVDGFNLMVRELKKNQIELAEVERETAWREMAKQVAHEIKNPLTPMKLAVQHLVAAHMDKSDKFNSIFDKVTKTIISQIDTLKNIASEFSSFAKMPSMKLEKFNLVEIITETVDLFIEENCNVELVTKEQSIILESDKEQTQRMFVNLIRNAIQANAKKIIISVFNFEEKIVVEISDDGGGIEKNNQQNIFDDNFTTKETGSGLGLALTKRFLNMTNGTISIKKTSQKGTTLLIEIRKT